MARARHKHRPEKVSIFNRIKQKDFLKDPLRALERALRSFQLAKISLWSGKNLLGAPPAGASEVTSRVPDADVTPATDVFQDSIHTAPRPKTGSPLKQVFCTAKHHIRCQSSRLWIDFDEFAQRFFVKLLTIVWVQ